MTFVWKEQRIVYISYWDRHGIIPIKVSWKMRMYQLSLHSIWNSPRSSLCFFYRLISPMLPSQMVTISHSKNIDKFLLSISLFSIAQMRASNGIPNDCWFVWTLVWSTSTGLFRSLLLLILLIFCDSYVSHWQSIINCRSASHEILPTDYPNCRRADANQDSTG